MATTNPALFMDVWRFHPIQEVWNADLVHWESKFFFEYIVLLTYLKLGDKLGQNRWRNLGTCDVFQSSASGNVLRGRTTEARPGYAIALNLSKQFRSLNSSHSFECFSPSRLRQTLRQLMRLGSRQWTRTVHLEAILRISCTPIRPSPPFFQCKMCSALAIPPPSPASMGVAGVPPSIPGTWLVAVWPNHPRWPLVGCHHLWADADVRISSTIRACHEEPSLCTTKTKACITDRSIDR